MARRKRTSPLEDTLDLFARMPWWACVALAVLGYLVLNQVATAYGQPALAAKAGTAKMAELFQGAVIGGVARIAQYVVPLLLLASAALSAWRRRQRHALLESVAQAPAAANALDGMSWREFEVLVGEAYRLQGFQVSETGGGGPDGGVDLVLARGGEKFLVQCKQWKAFRVGVDTVRELYGVMAARGAAGGFVVTSGRFTKDAREFTQGRNIQLVDGPRLLSMIQQVRQFGAEPVGTFIPAPGAPVNAATAAAERAASEPAATGQGVAPQAAGQPGCPQCGAGMVRRIARTGSNAGGSFWGCSTFPACRGVRQVDG
jgi:restriction system protein